MADVLLGSSIQVPSAWAFCQFITVRTIQHAAVLGYEISQVGKIDRTCRGIKIITVALDP